MSAAADGYAVVMADGAFVGIWRDRATAEKIVNRSPSAKGERIEPMYFAAAGRSLGTPITDARAFPAMTEGPLPDGCSTKAQDTDDIRPFEHDLLGPCVLWKVVTVETARALEKQLGDAMDRCDEALAHAEEAVRQRDAARNADLCTDGQPHLWGARHEGGANGHSYGPLCVKCGRGQIAGYSTSLPQAPDSRGRK